MGMAKKAMLRPPASSIAEDVRLDLLSWNSGVRSGDPRQLHDAVIYL